MNRPLSVRSSARWLIAPAFAALAAFGAACTKSESEQPAATTAPTPETTTAPAASTAPIATATGTTDTTDTTEAPADTAAAAPKAAADAGRAAAEPTKVDGGASTAPAASGSAGAAGCGTKPLPDCPLQAWMKTEANPPVMKNDLPGLATVLDKVVAFAPPGYTNWASIAKDGANAARAGDLAAAKASCRTCHDQYKQKYKTEHRARKI